jgi:7,8-dihydroneopterin 2',3'-cyclic phosphate phosphodiesterase
MTIEELIKLAEKINDNNLREKVIDLIKNPKLTFLDPPNDHINFEISPASKRRHHSYEKGLIIHTLATTKIALALCDIIEEVYKTKVNRDIVIAASLLHDLFKYFTYSQEESKYKRSSIGERIDHLSLIISEMYARRFPLEVIHAVLAHHGKTGPIEPRTLEALIVHMADSVDAEINDEVFFAAKNIIKECMGIDLEILPKGISPFEIIKVKKEEGCEGIKRIFEVKKCTG